MKINWLSYVIPFISIGLSYILGRLENYNQKKLGAAKERYEKFYKEFILLLVKSAPLKNDYSQISFEGRAQFFDLIINNFHLIDEQTAALSINYYYAFLEMLEYEENSSSADIPINYNRIFNELIDSALKESSKLSRKLKLPDLSKVVLDTDVHH